MRDIILFNLELPGCAVHGYQVIPVKDDFISIPVTILRFGVDLNFPLGAYGAEKRAVNGRRGFQLAGAHASGALDG
jgi:hypothetical protein